MGQKSRLRHYCIRNVKDGTQIRVYKINKESVIHFSHVISVKVKKNLRKSQARFREKLRNRLRQRGGFLMKKLVVAKLVTAWRVGYVSNGAVLKL